jgi:DNA-binding MarR family transcriptional regulator
MQDDEVRQIRRQMRALQRRLRAEAVPVAGVSRTSLRVMSEVARHPAGVAPGGIAVELQMTTSNVATALRELAAAGLVARERQADDARRVRVLLTAAGTAVIDGRRSEKDTWLGRAVDAVLDGEEQRLLVAAGNLMQRLADYIPGSGSAAMRAGGGGHDPRVPGGRPS